MGAANVFRITITASDKATKTIRDIKNNWSKFTRPITQTGRSLAALGKETGLYKVGKGLAFASRGALTLAEGVTGIGLGLAALQGIKSLGTMFPEWANEGRNLGYLAQTTGESTDALQDWRNAARLSGIEAKNLDQALSSMGASLHKARFPGAAELTMAYNKFPELRKYLDRSKVEKPSAALLDVSKLLQRFKGDPYTQQHILEALGISEELLPLLQKGPDELKRLMAQGRQTDFQTKEVLARAKKSADTVSKFESAWSGLMNSISSRMTWIDSIVESATGVLTRRQQKVEKKNSAAAGFGIEGRTLSHMFDIWDYGSPASPQKSKTKAKTGDEWPGPSASLKQQVEWALRHRDQDMPNQKGITGRRFAEEWSPLVAPSKKTEITVRFENAPVGMKVKAPRDTRVYVNTVGTGNHL